jgi:hypothetical protein
MLSLLTSAAFSKSLSLTALYFSYSSSFPSNILSFFILGTFYLKVDSPTPAPKPLFETLLSPALGVAPLFFEPFDIKDEFFRYFSDSS